GANSNEVIGRVKERISQVEKTLPEGVVIKSYLDRSSLVQRTIKTVRNNLVEGGLIVVFVLVLLLGNLRAGLIVASVIPLSMLFALGMMQLTGVSANLMSLGAIDFGLIVDGAVIIVESTIFRLHSRFPGLRLNQDEMDESVISSSIEMLRSAAFGMIIILIVYLPILALEGVEGKMFGPMAQTVAYAILGALLLSLTYVPMASALFLSKKQQEHRTLADRLIEGIHHIYKPVLIFALRFRWLMLGLTLAVFLASLLVLSRLGGEFIPQLDEGDMAMQLSVPPGSSLSHSVRTCTRAEQILTSQFPEVLQVISKIGTAEVPTDPMAVEDADIMISLKEKEEWTSAHSREEMVAKMEKALEPLAKEGASFEFTQRIELRFNELLTGAKADVTVNMYGEDLQKLADLGEEASKIIRPISGAADVKL
ncbi:MAG: efflux RND transporter permease subunit, partial [Bacteroidetes bacterium]